MIFKSFPLAEAEGLILAHSLRLPAGTFKKGRVLSPADLAALAEAGHGEVTGARLEAGDVPEDEAAAAIAAALAGDNVTAAAPFTGRANLFAAERGLLVFDRRRLNAVNAVDETITVATVAPGEMVAPRQMIATIKVIPFAVERPVLQRCLAAAAGAPPLIAVQPFRPQRVALVLTTQPGMKETVLEATAAASRARVESLGGSLVFERRCSHRHQALLATVQEAIAGGCTLLLIAGASATVDRRDVVPAAVVAAGGTVLHFGMPVDPGNLMLLARIGEVPVLGLPGCARSIKPNGVDLVLRRLMAGLPTGPADIMGLGAGGLLKETERPLPRAAAGRPAAAAAEPRRRPRIGGLVLAAGLSSRMGRNKLLIELDGKPLVVHAATAALEAQLDPVVAVTGHQAELVQAALAALPLVWMHNPDYAAGLASSLKAGLQALPADLDGVVVCLGDMPALTAAHLGRLLAAFDPAEGRAICVPVHRGKRGNPVLLGRQFFAEMRELSGDSGARNLIARHDEWVCEVAMPDDAVLTDVDTAEALAKLLERR